MHINKKFVTNFHEYHGSHYRTYGESDPSGSVLEGLFSGQAKAKVGSTTIYRLGSIYTSKLAQKGDTY